MGIDTVIDLDALKRDLKAAGYPVEQMTPSLIGFSITAPDRALAWEIHALVWSSGECDVWATDNNGAHVCMPGEPIAAALAIIARHVSPQPSPDRAALVERMAETIRSTWVEWEIDDTAGGKTYAAVAAEAALAAVEAAGGWPPMEMTELKPFVGKDVSGE